MLYEAGKESEDRVMTDPMANRIAMVQRRRRHRMRRPGAVFGAAAVAKGCFATAMMGVATTAVGAYHHVPCTRLEQAQFQWPDCYLPPYRDDLPLSQASFLMSHDTATGYITQNSFRQPSGSSWTWWYSKNQQGTVYQQLQDGARALDLRPYQLANGTLVFHHGAILIPIPVTRALTEVLQWTTDHPDELVILLFSHFGYQQQSQSQSQQSSNLEDCDDSTSSSASNLLPTLTSVLSDYGIAYFDCSQVSEWTMAQVMEQTTIAPASNNNNNQGRILVLVNENDPGGSSCAKENWVESQLVTCYPKSSRETCLSFPANNKNNGNTTNTTALQRQLRHYLLTSANNPATDDASTLGPPATLSQTPLFEIQALWQVTAYSAVMGLEHFSSIPNDNVHSRINDFVLDMVYNSEFDTISLLVMDNIALHGNAITSVLRNQCGQSFRDDEEDIAIACGSALPKPSLWPRFYVTPIQAIMACLIIGYVFWFTYSIIYHQRPKLLYTAFARACQPSQSDPSKIDHLLT